MTQEQKAKRYDGALHAAKAWHNTFVNTKEDKNLKQLLETIFPELKESEEEMVEKIRKDIISYLNNRQITSIAESSATERWLAWLEKQGEKPKKVSIWKHWKDGIAGNGDGKQIYLIKTGNIYDISSCLGCECDYIELSELDELTREEKKAPKNKTALDKAVEEEVDAWIKKQEGQSNFKVGDWVVSGKYIVRISKIQGQYYIGNDIYGNDLTLRSDRVRFWTIEDAKDGDVLVYNNSSVEIILLFEKWINGVGEGAYSYAHTFDNKILFNDWSDCGYATHPATKEQRDLLFAKMKDAGYEFDFEKKELKKLHIIDEGKDEMDYCFTKMMNGEKVSSAWSEEDEKNWLGIIDEIEANKSNAPDYDIETYDRFLSWLKSLKQRLQ